MKTIVDLEMLFPIPACDFRLMQGNATVVCGDSAVETESVNKWIMLYGKVFNIPVVEVIPEEPPDRMTLQFVPSSIGNRFICALGQEQRSFILEHRFVVHILNRLSGKSLDHKVNRNNETLQISFEFIVIAAQPGHLETDTVPGSGNIAVVPQIAFDSSAFSMFSELIVQGIFRQQEALGSTVLLIVGYNGNKQTTAGQRDKNGVVENIHSSISFLSSMMCFVPRRMP